MNNVRTEPAPTYNNGQELPYEFTAEETLMLEATCEIIERKYLRKSDALRSPELTRQYLCSHLAQEPFEVFGVLWLDNRHRVIETVNLFNGTVDGAAVYPRVVATSALKHHASACIFFHNHPSGNPEPSQADITLTTKLKSTLALLDIRVLDHIVVGGVDTISLAERGLL